MNTKRRRTGRWVLPRGQAVLAEVAPRLVGVDAADPAACDGVLHDTDAADPTARYPMSGDSRRELCCSFREIASTKPRPPVPTGPSSTSKTSVPAQQTEQARAATAAWLARASAWVRVNPCGTDDFLVDVDRARQHQVLPGSSSPRPSEPRIWTDRHQGNTPTLIDPQLVRNVDVVVTLGREARVNPMPGTRFENWDTDEPSDRGIGGMERMRLVRDDIADRVADLLTRIQIP